MIRLYVDQEFRVNDKIPLPQAEWRYFEKVRRGQGPVELFNRQGQVASGKIHSKSFLIAAVECRELPASGISLAVGLPEKQKLKSIITSLSEIGVEKLYFFGAQRSQSAKKRLRDLNLEVLNQVAIESARQCARGKVLEIEIKELAVLLGLPNHSKWVLDESDSQPGLAELRAWPRKDHKSVFFVGPEGGWTEAERQQFLQAGVRAFHLPTPILRVETACCAAAILAVSSKYGPSASDLN